MSRVAYRVVREGEIAYTAYLTLDGRPTNANCGHRHLSPQLATTCALRDFVRKWTRIIDGPHSIGVYLDGPVGRTIYRVTYPRPGKRDGWENFSYLESAGEVLAPSDTPMAH